MPNLASMRLSWRRRSAALRLRGSSRQQTLCCRANMADVAAAAEAKLFGKWSFDDVEVRAHTGLRGAWHVKQAQADNI